MNDVVRPVTKKGVMDIAAYVPGKDTVHGVEKVYKLSSNETPLGPSKHVASAMQEALDQLEVYPDGSATVLRDAIAEAHGLNPANILCGNGSDELLGLLCQTYLSEGDEAIYSQHGFLVYKIQILANGATPVVAKEENLTTNVDEMLSLVTDKTKMVFVANPNNPTGTYIPIEELRRLHDALPKHVVLVLDAAYAEYVRKNDYEAGIELVSSNENVVMTRTFSKIYGLAGLRIGWLYGPSAIIDALNRVRGPFNVSSLSIAAGSAAIKDKSHVEAAVEHNQLWLDKLSAAFTELGLETTPSVGNFLLIHFPKDSARGADAANDFLLSKGFVLRKVTSYGLPNALRMSIGTEEANLGVLSALKEFMS